MDNDGFEEHLIFLHQVIDDYNLNGGYESHDTDSDGFPSAGEDDEAEDACETELEEHVFKKKLEYIKKNCSSSDEDSDIFGQTESSEKKPAESRLREIQLIKEAMDVNLKMRDTLLNVEQNLVQALHVVTSKKRGLRLTECGYTQIVKIDCSDPWSVPVGFYNQFGMPYFKDKNFFSCPPNQDTERKVSSKELMAHNIDQRPWKIHDIKYLEIGVKNCLIDEYKERKLRSDSPTMTTTAYINKVKHTSLIDLIPSHRDNFDWMKISAAIFKGTRSEIECEKMWKLYLSPTVNKKVWSKEEQKQLKSIAAKWNNQNWKAIANELGNGRTQFQCFVQYQTKLAGHINPGPWMEEEDARLKSIIKICRYGSFISWQRVCYFMEGRTLNQLYARWNNCLNPQLKKGKFTQREDSIIIDGIYNQGQDCREIARTLGNRNSSQIRERYSNQLKTLFERNTGEWTLEEDTLLLELVKELGESHWSEVSYRMKSRSRVQVRHRYNLLKARKEQNPDFKITDLKRSKRGFIARQNRKQKLYQKMWVKIKNRKKQRVTTRIPQEKKKRITNKINDLPPLKLMSHPEWDRKMKLFFRRKAVKDALKIENMDSEDEKTETMNSDKGETESFEYFLKSQKLYVKIFEDKLSDTFKHDTELAQDLEVLGQLFKLRFNWKDVYHEALADNRLKPIHRAMKLLKEKYEELEEKEKTQCENIAQPSSGIYEDLLPPNILSITALDGLSESKLQAYIDSIPWSTKQKDEEKSPQFDDEETRAGFSQEEDLFKKRLRTLLFWPALFSQMAEMGLSDENNADNLENS